MTLSKIKRLYTEAHSYGKFLAIGIFATHGVFDAFTTLAGYFMITQRGLSFSDVETNPIIHSLGGPIQIGSFILVAGLIVSILPLIMYRIIDLSDDSGRRMRLTADFVFSLIFVAGLLLVFNNVMALISF